MKDSTRLKLWVTGLAFIVSAAVLCVAVISWGWAKSDRNTIFLVVRCVYAVGVAVALAAGHHYASEHKPPPFRPWILIPLVIIGAYVATGPLVDSLLAQYPNGLPSIRCVFIYTMALILMGLWAPVHYYAVRYYRSRTGTLSDDHACCSDDSKKT
jgi:MFS family permease